jgi:hypothetical protein
MSAQPFHLSKSKLIAFRQCPKRLWLEIHRPELRDDSGATIASFQVGFQVGEVARQIYDPTEAGTLVDVESLGFEEAFALTAKLLVESRQPIFEAGLRGDGAMSFADVLLPVETSDGPAWRMVEVKSSTELKDYHRDDVAIQTHAARAADMRLDSVSLAHIDSKWVYPGGGNYRGLLTEVDLTIEAFGRAGEVAEWVREAHDVAALPSAPDIAPGTQCHAPFACGFCAHCAPPQTDGPEYPLEWLPKMRAAKREALRSQGIDDLREVPDEWLSRRQQLVKTHTAAGSTFFDAAGAASDLAAYALPVRFLDFETIFFPVPIWAGTRPYQQIPFQFSLHVVDEGQLVSHREFLDLSGDDPSRALALTLLDACGDCGAVFAYNASFESRVIHELAERLPDLAAGLHAVSQRLVDLLPIAMTRFYHPSQQGSWSLKKVLPAIAPELNYDQLAGVQDGGMAMEAFVEAISPEITPERKAQITQDLLAYCKLDTYATVRLWEVFIGRTPLCP